MTERQVWLKLADRCAADIRSAVNYEGLCIYLTDLRGISKGVLIAMQGRLDAAVDRRIRRDGNGWSVYAWPLDEKGHRQRIAFCKRQVARIDRERRKRRATR